MEMKVCGPPSVILQYLCGSKILISFVKIAVKKTSPSQQTTVHFFVENVGVYSVQPLPCAKAISRDSPEALSDISAVAVA
jgi:hypothetical protein